MKLLITGGAGFIGSNFIRYWFNNYPEDKIINLDALTYAGNPENLHEVAGLPNYRFVKGNICDAKLVNKVMQGIDTVVHFAAESHVDRSILTPAIFIETNVLGTQVLLTAALKNKVKRFHHISTDEVFGELELEEKKKFSEKSPYSPNSPYAASKAASDHLVRAFFKTYGLAVTISNCSNNYGPYQHPEKLIPLAITNLIEEKNVPVYGDGKNVRDWLYVEDHCRGIERVITDGIIGETYCLGGLTRDIANLEVVRKILKLFMKNDSFIHYVKDRPGHDRKYAINWQKARQKLGWQPRENFETGLIKTVNWYKNNSSWWKKLKDGNFKKYYQRQYQI